MDDVIGIVLQSAELFDMRPDFSSTEFSVVEKETIKGIQASE